MQPIIFSYRRSREGDRQHLRRGGLSEAVVVVSDESLHVVERLKAFEHAVLKDSMKLVLEARQHRVLLVDIETELLERRFPVQLVQVKQLELMDDLAHACLDFCLVKEILSLKKILSWQFTSRRFKPRIASLESSNRTRSKVTNLLASAIEKARLSRGLALDWVGVVLTCGGKRGWLMWSTEAASSSSAS